MGHYVNYGCGLTTAEGWINFDASPSLRVRRSIALGWIARIRGSAWPAWPANARYGDIVKGLPLGERSCSGAYCSHILEHLSLQDCELALKNTFRLLEPRGVFRLVMPDLETLVQDYVHADDADAGKRFMRNTGIATEKRSRGFRAFLTEWRGNSSHLWLWDYKGIEALLSGIGFCEVRRASLGDANDELFSAVEAPDRWEHALGVECRRP